MSLALKLLLIYFAYVNSMSMTIVAADLWSWLCHGCGGQWAEQKLWNCGSIDGWIILSIVKNIITLCLLLTAFIKSPCTAFCIFVVWLASQTSWLELLSGAELSCSLLARL